MPFEATNGISRVDQLFRAVRDIPTGTLVPYRDLPYDRPTLHQLKDKVAKRMEAEQQRTLASERDQGWRIVAGIAHVDLADRDRRLSVRRMKRALTRSSTVDYRELSGQERQRADDVHIRIAVAHQQIRSSGRKLGLEDIKRWQSEREAA